MDSFHASCEGLKGPHFIHLFTLQISHNLTLTQVYSQIVAEPGSSMKTTLTSQPGRERLLSLKKKKFCFFRPISGFFRLVSSFFARVFHMTKDASGNLFPEFVTKQALSMST